MTHQLATQAEQATAQALGEKLHDLVMSYLADFTPPGVDPATLTMNVGCAAVQALGLAEVDHGGRLSFVEGAGYALGIIHAQYADHGVGAIEAALSRGFARGARDAGKAIAPRGTV